MIDTRGEVLMARGWVIEVVRFCDDDLLRVPSGETDRDSRRRSVLVPKGDS